MLKLAFSTVLPHRVAICLSIYYGCRLLCVHVTPHRIKRLIIVPDAQHLSGRAIVGLVLCSLTPPLVLLPKNSCLQLETGSTRAVKVNHIQ